MPLDENRRAQLDGIVRQMDAKGAPPADIKAVVEDFKSKYDAAPQGAASRFGGALADAIPEPIRHPSMLGQVPGAIADIARESPMDLLMPSRMIGRDIGQQAVDSFQSQRAKGTNMVSALAAGVPVIGPAGAQVGEDIGRGDYAAAAGHAIPLLAPFAAKGLRGPIGSAAEGTRSAVSTGARATGAAVKAGVKGGFNAVVEGKGLSSGVATGLKEGLATLGEQVAAKLEARGAARLAAAVRAEPALVADLLPAEVAPKALSEARLQAPPKTAPAAENPVEVAANPANPMTAKEAARASNPKSPKPMTPKEEARAAAPKPKKPMTPKEEARTGSAKTAEELEKSVVAKWEEMTRADLKTGDAAYQTGRRAYKTAQLRDLIKWKFGVPDSAGAEMVGAIKQAYGLK